MKSLPRSCRYLPGLVAALAWTAVALAQAAPETTYIVQSASLDSARTQVRRVGAEPERDLDIINAVAVRLTDVAGGHVRIVLEHDQVLAVDRLTDEPFLEHHGVHGKEVVAHHPRVLQVRRGRNEVADYGGMTLKLEFIVPLFPMASTI